MTGPATCHPIFHGVTARGERLVCRPGLSCVRPPLLCSFQSHSRLSSPPPFRIVEYRVRDGLYVEQLLPPPYSVSPRSRTLVTRVPSPACSAQRAGLFDLHVLWFMFMIIWGGGSSGAQANRRSHLIYLIISIWTPRRVLPCLHHNIYSLLLQHLDVPEIARWSSRSRHKCCVSVSGRHASRARSNPYIITPTTKDRHTSSQPRILDDASPASRPDQPTFSRLLSCRRRRRPGHLDVEGAQQGGHGPLGLDRDTAGVTTSSIWLLPICFWPECVIAMARPGSA